MPYRPWPEDGCTLAEARERTAERELWAKRQRLLNDLAKLDPQSSRRGRLETEIIEIDNKIDARFFSLFGKQKLIAYGRRNDLTSERESIIDRLWPLLNKVNWQESAACESRRGGIAFLSVRVFPALRAPCRVDLVAGRTIAEVFREFVLEDPEVAELAEAAIRSAPELKRVFRDGNCYVHGTNEWPLRQDADLVGIGRPDKEGWSLGALRKPYPQEVLDAADALTDRFNALLGTLRSGELEGRGIPLKGGAEQTLLRSVWSQREFFFDPRCGDILQVNPDCEDPPLDFLRKRWLGIVIDRPSKAAKEESKTLKPPKRSELIAATASPDEGKTAVRASIRAAIAALWPKGIPAGLMKQTRNREIIAWQRRQDGLAIASEKTIRRFFKESN